MQETEDFKNKFCNFKQENTEKPTTFEIKSIKPATKRPMNSNSPLENNKESHNCAKFSKKNSNLKASVSADFNNKVHSKANVTHANSIPLTNPNKYLGPIQRPNNSYQNQNSSNINNNITNNLFLTLPNGAFSISNENDLLARLNLAAAAAAAAGPTVTLDQILQLSGEEILSLLAAKANLQEDCYVKNNKNKMASGLNENELYFDLMKLNNPATTAQAPVTTTTTLAQTNKKQPTLENNFDEFNLFGAKVDLDKGLEKVTGFNTAKLPEVNEASTLYWPPIDSINTTTALIPEQPWNSVLLNDFDAPASLSSSSTGNHIRNLWSTNTKDNQETNKNE